MPIWEYMTTDPRAFHADPVGFLRRLAEEQGDLVRFELGSRAYWLVSRPDLVRALLVEHADHLRKPAWVRDSNRGHFGDGLTTLENPEWRARRSRVQPAFRVDEPAHARLVETCTLDLLATLPRDRPFDLRAALRTLVARLAARSLLDADLEGLGPSD